MNKHAIREAFASLPPVDDTAHPAWQNRQRKLRRAVAGRNPNGFLRWGVIRGAMFVGDVPFIRRMYDELMEDERQWAHVIEEPRTGNPVRLPYADWTSGNLVLQAYHIKQWMDTTGRDVADLDSILEIGGGYGALALVCQRLGFKGVYLSYDLPEMLILQHFYLKESGYRVEALDGLGGLEVDLLIALASWAEMPMDGRGEVESVDADSYLITYKPRTFGDNERYFAEFVADKQDFVWHSELVAGKNKQEYLIGWMKH